jgi:hypothetical protein
MAREAAVWRRAWVLDEAKQRGQRITMIARVDDQRRDQVRQLEQLQARFQYELIELKYVHMKLYLSERAAILSSMNLWDSSKEKNYELAYLFEGRRSAKEFLQNIVEAELLSAPRVKTLKGWFSDADAAERAAIESKIRDIGAHGFCVVCGEKCNLDLSKEPTKIRCRPCWSRSPDRDSSDLRTAFCHYCGKEHRARGSAPLHEPCRAEVETILKSRYYKPEW